MWWEYFHRCGFTEEEHVESRATLGALTYDGEAGQVKRSVIHRYRFPEQPHDIKVGDSPKNRTPRNPMSSSEGSAGRWSPRMRPPARFELKRGRSSPMPHSAALVPLDNVQNTVLRESLARLAAGPRRGAMSGSTTSSTSSIVVA